jgi:hypothetical protein
VAKKPARKGVGRVKVRKDCCGECGRGIVHVGILAGVLQGRPEGGRFYSRHAERKYSGNRTAREEIENVAGTHVRPG